MSLLFREEDDKIIVYGNTYKYKDKIKALGARYNGQDKNWILENKAQNISALNELISGNIEAKPKSPSVAKSAAIMNKNSTDLSVSDLMNKINSVLNQEFTKQFWVVGEIQNLSKKTSGYFFDLSENSQTGHQNSTTTVRAILWKNSYKFIALRNKKSDPNDNSIDAVLCDGIKVRMLCQLNFYQARAQVSLVVEDIDPKYSLGALALAREELLKELRLKNLLDANKKLKLSNFPLRIGLITAATSRAYSDFIDQLESGGYIGEVLFVEAQMQGEKVPKQVSAAILKLEQHCDLVVITRGGGSAADLRWFDAKEIAYAIAGAKVPILCAIGHHDDVSVAEEVAYIRQKTPTAAAEYILSIFAQTLFYIEKLSQKMATILETANEEIKEQCVAILMRFESNIERLFARKKDELVHLVKELSFTGTERINSMNVVVNDISHHLDNNLNDSLSKLELKLSNLESMIKQADPAPWQKKGWTQLFNVSSSKKKRIKTTDDVKIGDEIYVNLHKAKLNLIVNNIEKR